LPKCRLVDEDVFCVAVGMIYSWLLMM
jgi:hypothetical protein